MNKNTWKTFAVLGAATLVIGGALYSQLRFHAAAVQAVASRAPTIPLAAVNAPTSPRPATKAADDPDQVALCGMGTVTLDSKDPLAVTRYLTALTQPTSDRWLAALQNSNDPHQRAAGLLLKGNIPELVDLAQSSEDPALYALALYACNGRPGEAAPAMCQQLSFAGWADLDAENAVPWLQLARLAREGHDPAAEASAFARAAGAGRVDAYDDALFAFAQPALPKESTALTRSFLATQIIGLGASMSAPPSIVFQHCSRDAMQDPNVNQQCEAVAELLVNTGTTLVDAAVGEHLGERAGWSADRVAQLTAERNALTQALRASTPTSNRDQFTCPGVALVNDYIQRRLQWGELGAARRARERTPTQ